MKNKVIIKIKKKLYNVVALPALKNLFRILPIAKNKIVFDNFCGKGYGGNPKYIAEAISVSRLCFLLYCDKYISLCFEYRKIQEL